MNNINVNELKENKFRLLIRSLPNTIYFSRSVNLPGINQSSIDVSSPINNYNLGSSRLVYDELSVEFAIQESLENYLEIFNWIVSITAPEKYEQYQSFKIEKAEDPRKYNTSPYKPYNKNVSDATLITLSNSHNSYLEFSFKNIFPISLSGINFNEATDSNNVLFATATFKIDSFSLSNKILS